MQGKKTYNINLDPAVLEVKFPANIDIRDSVKYKSIMKSYKLGIYIPFSFYCLKRTQWCYIDLSEHICSVIRLSNQTYRTEID